MGKLKCRNEIEMLTMPSMCDRNSVMDLPAMLDMFQDMAGIHADSVGIGALDMEERGLFWIVSKIRLRVNRRPKMGELLNAATWIQPSERATCERDFSISADGEQLAYVRSIWAALRRDNGRPAPMADFYPDADFDAAPPDSDPFSRLSKKFEDAEPLGEYTIRSVDIDRGGHMNNVNYVRALLGCFTCEQIEAMDIKELDMQFLLQCYEGETVSFVKRGAEGSIMEAGALNSEGKVCFMAAIR